MYNVHLTSNSGLQVFIRPVAVRFGPMKADADPIAVWRLPPATPDTRDSV
jgi:hypothetical protein